MRHKKGEKLETTKNETKPNQKKEIEMEAKRRRNDVGRNGTEKSK